MLPRATSPPQRGTMSNNIHIEKEKIFKLKEKILAKIKQNGIKQGVLTAAHCANACRHLLTDERLLKAIDAALNFESYSKKALIDIFEDADSITNAALGAVIWACWVNDRGDSRAIADASVATLNAFESARATSDSKAMDSASDAIYLATKALKNKKIIENIINEHLPL